MADTSTGDRIKAVREDVAALREDAASDEVETLLTVIERQTTVIADLQERVERTETRTAQLRRHVSGASPDFESPHFDREDETVMQIVENRDLDVVSISKFHSLYRKYTRLSQEETIKQHIKQITEHGPFERESTRGPSAWTYVGEA